jgi:hypothetical protein
MLLPYERFDADRRLLQSEFGRFTRGLGTVQDLRVQEAPGEPGRIVYSIRFEYLGHHCDGVMHIATANSRDEDAFTELAEIAAGALGDLAARAERAARVRSPSPQRAAQSRQPRPA